MRKSWQRMVLTSPSAGGSPGQGRPAAAEGTQAAVRVLSGGMESHEQWLNNFFVSSQLTEFLDDPNNVISGAALKKKKKRESRKGP